jgi:hypothetical protein
LASVIARAGYAIVRQKETTMWKRYIAFVAGLTVLIVMLRIWLRPDPLAHGSWQILTENILLMPGLFIIGPVFGSPEDPMIASFCYWAIIIISAAVYAVPFTVVLKLWKSFKVNKR